MKHFLDFLFGKKLPKDDRIVCESWKQRHQLGVWFLPWRWNNDDIVNLFERMGIKAPFKLQGGSYPYQMCVTSAKGKKCIVFLNCDFIEDTVAFIFDDGTRKESTLYPR